MNYRAVFEATPNPYLILAPTPGYMILAVNDAYLRATMTTRQQIVGQELFAIFPDRPDVEGLDGVENLSESLRRAVDQKATDIMAVQRYDIRKPNGEWDIRYWRPLNAPVVIDDKVAYIIHHVVDVTSVVEITGRKQG